MATRLLTGIRRPRRRRDRARQRTGDFCVIRAKAVILGCGAAGRLGLPASGYLFGTYENPTNAGDGYAMAYHAGAELTNRVLPDQPADQGLQRSGLRLRDRAVRRLHRQRPRPALHRVRLLERPDDAGVLPRAAVRRRAGVPEARPSGARDHRRDRDHPAPQRAPEPRPLPRARAARTTRTAWSRCTSPRSACAAATAPRASGSTSARDHGPRPVRRRRHGLRAAQLHARRLRIRQASRGETAADYCAEIDLRRARRGRRRGRARARAGAAAARGRPPAAPDRVQDAPPGQRLPAAAQDHRARSTSAWSASRESARTWTSSGAAIRTS